MQKEIETDPMSANRNENRGTEQEREAKRILAQVRQQTDGAAMTPVQKAVKRGREHFSAEDADRSDRVEVWGTRIGRAISLILFFVLIAYLTSIVMVKG